MGAGFGDLAEDLLGVFEEDFALLGEAEGTAEAVEEGCADFGFEALDLLGEGGLGDAFGLGSASETAVAGDGDEVTKLMELHVVNIQRRRPSPRD